MDYRPLLCLRLEVTQVSVLSTPLKVFRKWKRSNVVVVVVFGVDDAKRTS